jgi:sterol 24-C-methyltransferase
MAYSAIKKLARLSQRERQDYLEAYRFLQYIQENGGTSTHDETMAVAAYYKVLNHVLSVFDVEKMYVPPQLDRSKGLYENQLLCEREVLSYLGLTQGEESHLLDMGCGRGRVSHHMALMTGGMVSGYNIDPDQIESAIKWSVETRLTHRLHYKVGDHHHPLPYESAVFDGCYSIQAVWPFFKPAELDAHAREMFRVLKPGARYSCSEYLLSPHFDWQNPDHVALQKSYLPTLAGTHSRYPEEVCSALERAGFIIHMSAPSKSVAWPICEQKRDLITCVRRGAHILSKLHILSPWLDEVLSLLQKGGQSWTEAEKAKIADLNWRIVAEKPRN